MSAKPASSLKIDKLVATGNDFLFVDARNPLPGEYDRADRSELTRRLCDRHFGLGADGVVFMAGDAATGRFQWDFFNSDGSHAEMCGNASRCAGRWAQINFGLPMVHLQTAAGNVRCEVGGYDVISHLDYVRVAFRDLSYLVDGRPRYAQFVDTGVPHAVVEVSDIREARGAKEDIAALRFHPDLGAKGANVTFLQTLAADRFSTVTYERGVEDFTLSCGTGVLAAAAVGLRRTAGVSATLETPGGQLSVVFGPNWAGAQLSGSARLVFSTFLGEEFLR